MTGFVADFHRLVEHCNFAQSLWRQLRDHVVWGVRESRIQHRLLGEKSLTFKKALERATAMAVAEKHASDLQQEKEETVNKLRHATTNPTPSDH